MISAARSMWRWRWRGGGWDLQRVGVAGRLSLRWRGGAIIEGGGRTWARVLDSGTRCVDDTWHGRRGGCDVGDIACRRYCIVRQDRQGSFRLQQLHVDLWSVLRALALGAGVARSGHAFCPNNCSGAVVNNIPVGITYRGNNTPVGITVIARRNNSCMLSLPGRWRSGTTAPPINTGRRFEPRRGRWRSEGW
eukprot:1182882-Prorocentrum_minimum.AAC.6